MLAVIITSVLLGLAVIAARAVLSKRLNGRTMMIIWAVVFVKFALPVNISTDFSVMNVFEANNAANGIETGSEHIKHMQSNGSLPGEDYSYIQSNEYITENARTQYDNRYEEFKNNENTYYAEHESVVTSVGAYEIASPSEEAAGTVSEESVKSVLNPDEIIADIYVIVAVMLMSAIIFTYIICIFRFSAFDKVCNGYIDGLIEKSGLKRKVTVSSGSTDTPVVFGIIRPEILLPCGLDMSDTQSVYHIIIHELTHIRHIDTLWNLLTLIICAFNWYNPVVWICRSLFLKDAEKYCDESVIMQIGAENRADYAQSLLKCAGERSKRFMLVSGFGESDIKSRIKAVMSIKKVRMGTVMISLAVIIVLAVVFGTGAADRPNVSMSGKEYTESGFVYKGEITDKTGSGGEISLNISSIYGNEKNPYYKSFSLELESEKYTIGKIHVLTEMKNLKRYRFLPEEPVTAKNGSRLDGASDERDISPDKPFWELFTEWDHTAYSEDMPEVRVTVTYTLKDGLRTAGEYTIEACYDPFSEEEISYYDPEKYNELTGDGSSFKMSKADGGVMISSNQTDMYIFTCLERSVQNEFEYGESYLCRKGTDIIEKLDFPLSMDRDHLRLTDVTGEGVYDLVRLSYPTGTGVTSNIVNVYDGQTCREISVDTEAARLKMQDFCSSLPVDCFFTQSYDVVYGGELVLIGSIYNNIYTQVSPSFMDTMLHFEYKDGVLEPCGEPEQYVYDITGVEEDILLHTGFDAERFNSAERYAGFKAEKTDETDGHVFYEIRSDKTPVYVKCCIYRMSAKDISQSDDRELYLYSSGYIIPYISFAVCRDREDGSGVESSVPLYSGIPLNDDTKWYLEDMTGDGVPELIIQMFGEKAGKGENLEIFDGASGDKLYIDFDGIKALTNQINIEVKSPNNVEISYKETVFDHVCPSELKGDYSAKERFTYRNFSKDGFKLHYEKLIDTENVGEWTALSAELDIRLYIDKFRPTGKVRFENNYDISDNSAHSDGILWSYDILGYESLHTVSLVMRNEVIGLDRMNSDTFAECFELVVTANGVESDRISLFDGELSRFGSEFDLNGDISQYFRFTYIDDDDPGIIIFSLPVEKDTLYNSSEQMYISTVYKVDGSGKIHQCIPLKANGVNAPENSASSSCILVSESFSADRVGIYTDSFANRSGGTVNVRYRLELSDTAESGYAFNMYEYTDSAESYRQLEKIYVSRAEQLYYSGDYAQTVEDGAYYSAVSGSIYSTSDILYSIQKIAEESGFLNDTPVITDNYIETVLNIDESFYFFRLYDNNILEFKDKNDDFVEYYRIENRDRYLQEIRITMGGYGDYIANQIVM